MQSFRRWRSRTDVSLTLRWMTAWIVSSWLVLCIGYWFLVNSLMNAEQAPLQLVDSVAARAREGAPIVRLGAGDGVQQWKDILQNETSWTIQEGLWFATLQVESLALNQPPRCSPAVSCRPDADTWLVEVPIDERNQLSVAFDIAEAKTQFIQRGLWGMLFLFGVIILSVGGFGALLGWGVSRRLRLRLNALATTIDGWAAGGWGLRPALSHTHDELDDIALKLDQLVQRLALLSQGEVAAARASLLRTLHDNVKQDLFAVSLQLASMSSTDALDLAKATLGNAQGALAGLLGDAHEPMRLESPRALAVELASRWGRRIDLRGEDGWPLGHSARLAHAALREGLVNAFRHGGAGSIVVEWASLEGAFTLTIRNQGLLVFGRYRGGLTWLQSDAAASGGTLRLTQETPDTVLFLVEVPARG